ncbi:outer membrane protein, OMPP1/FadL/TodX family, partial [Acidithiobacillus sp. GGI-221]
YLQNLGPAGYAQAYSSITFMQMAPSVAWKANDRLSVGASLNIAAEQGSFQQTFSQNAPVVVGVGPNGPITQMMPQQGGLNLATPSWAYGVGATLGVLYKVNHMVTLGATYKSPILFTPMTWQAGLQNQVSPATGNGVIGAPGQYSGHLNYPQQIALGLAIRPIRQWLVSIEGQWINWHNTMNNFTIFGPWTAYQGGAAVGGLSSIALPMHWSNQWVANFGTQYDVNNWLQVRAGYTWGSNPISNNTIASNLIFPAIVQNAITFGATQKLGMGWKLTEAYMHEFSNTNTGPAGSSPFGGPMPASATMYENSYGIQVGYDF